MSDSISCDGCGAHGRRRRGDIAPEAWAYSITHTDADATFRYACSEPCKAVPWLKGPGWLTPLHDGFVLVSFGLTGAPRFVDEVPAEPPPGMLRPVIVAVRRQRVEGKPGRFWFGYHDGIEIVAPDDGTVRVVSLGVAQLIQKDWQ